MLSLLTWKISKNKIKEILCDIFIDNEEYTGQSFSRFFILHHVKNEYPGVPDDFLWKKVRYVIQQDCKKYTGDYMDLYLHVSPLDTMEERSEKFDDFIKICVKNKLIPLRVDRDINEYRCPANLQIHSELYGDNLSIQVKAVKRGFDAIAKTGGKLPSGRDVFECASDIRKIKELGYKHKEKK
jgi:hypothetical protein